MTQIISLEQTDDRRPADGTRYAIIGWSRAREIVMLYPSFSSEAEAEIYRQRQNQPGTIARMPASYRPVLEIPGWQVAITEPKYTADEINDLAEQIAQHWREAPHPMSPPGGSGEDAATSAKIARMDTANMSPDAYAAAVKRERATFAQTNAPEFISRDELTAIGATIQSTRPSRYNQPAVMEIWQTPAGARYIGNPSPNPTSRVYQRISGTPPPDRMSRNQLEDAGARLIDSRPVNNRSGTIGATNANDQMETWQTPTGHRYDGLASYNPFVEQYHLDKGDPAP